jgi:hypothetical protein
MSCGTKGFNIRFCFVLFFGFFPLSLSLSLSLSDQSTACFQMCQPDLPSFEGWLRLEEDKVESTDVGTGRTAMTAGRGRGITSVGCSGPLETAATFPARPISWNAENGVSRQV